jgi:DNA polymerase-3 subunit epsilon
VRMMFGLIKGIRKLPPGIDLKTPITDVPYVVLDTELTGLDEKKDSIISVGAVRMHGGKIDLGETFYRLASPKTKLSAQSVVIHEIMPSEVVEKPAIDAVLKEFLNFCGNDVLVGHFISIDLGFINREMKRIYGEEIRASALDTFSIYEWLRKRQKTRDCLAAPLAGYRLYDIVKCFSIPVNGAHNALMDAFTTAQLFQRFLPLIIEAGAKEIGDLLKIGIPFKGGDRFRLSGDFSNF